MNNNIIEESTKKGRKRNIRTEPQKLRLLKRKIDNLLKCLKREKENEGTGNFVNVDYDREELVKYLKMYLEEYGN